MGVLYHQRMPAMQHSPAVLRQRFAPGGEGAGGGVGGGTRVGGIAVGDLRDHFARRGVRHVETLALSRRYPLAVDEIVAADQFAQLVSLGHLKTPVVQARRCAIAAPTSAVFALPPRSPVCGPSLSVASIAARIASCASRSLPAPLPRKSSIIAADQIIAIG